MAWSSEDTIEHSSIIKPKVAITLMIWQGQVKKQLNTVLESDWFRKFYSGCNNLDDLTWSSGDIARSSEDTTEHSSIIKSQVNGNFTCCN